MALAMNMDYTAQYLKTILPAVAYYMLTGPWRRVWIRFGYDPRTEPGAKIYQVVDFRIKDSKLRLCYFWLTCHDHHYVPKSVCLVIVGPGH